VSYSLESRSLKVVHYFLANGTERRIGLAAGSLNLGQDVLAPDIKSAL